jgi:2,3-dihydroxybenzoate decarboxylase
MDLGPARIRRMDDAGIDLQVLSHVQPGVQGLDRETAVPLAREVNDWLAEIVAQYPTRFAGFAMLAPQSPEEAARELERAVVTLGFKGALINGHTQGRYLDEPEFGPLLACAQALDVPIYIHPTNPPDAVQRIYYKDWPVPQAWGWQVETGTHVLKLITAGVFDRYPGLKIIVGHMGEFLPFTLDRLNRGTTMAEWLMAAQAKTEPRMRKSLIHYMRENIFITTSGVFDQAALACAVAQLGIDNILFSVDDPFADSVEGVDFLKKAPLSEADRAKLAHGNAERLLKLGPGTARVKRPFSAVRARAKARLGQAVLSFLIK